MLSLFKPCTRVLQASKKQVYNAFWKRNLNLQEHLSYGILKSYGIPVPRYCVVASPDDAVMGARSLETDELIMKAQVLTGGRGKGKFQKSGKPGVISFKSPNDADELACAMLGDVLVTVQTGAEGKVCNSVMIAERKKAHKEYYLSVMMERATYHGPVIISSCRGGVEIEKVAVENPDAITKTPVDIILGLQKGTAEEVAEEMGLGDRKEEISLMIMKVYDLFMKTDATMVEINPLIMDEEGIFCCVDAKINFDDNAEFRQAEIFAKRDFSQEDPKEVQAAKFNLNYIALDGNIGCMVNGAGLAMATMDLIKITGGLPANFLDVGGGATTEVVKEAFKIITADPKVQAVLVNIFAGIGRCDIIANGVIQAVEELQVTIPIVVRLMGTNHLIAKDILKKSKLSIIANDDLAESAIQAVQLVKEKTHSE